MYSRWKDLFEDEENCELITDKRRVKEGEVKRVLKRKVELKTRGKKIDTEFYQRLKDTMMFTIIEKITAASGGSVPEYGVTKSINCAFTLAAVRQFAKTILEEGLKIGKYESMRNYQFGDPWVVRCLRRLDMQRRRTTTQEKPKPSEEAIRTWQKNLQEKLQSGGYPHSLIWNMDETAFKWNLPIKYQYVSKDAQRGVSLAGNETQKFTAFIGGSADGTFVPSFSIIGANCKNKLDMSTSTVLQTVLKSLPDKEAWEFGVYENNIGVGRADKRSNSKLGQE